MNGIRWSVSAKVKKGLENPIEKENSHTRHISDVRRKWSHGLKSGKKGIY